MQEDNMPPFQGLLLKSPTSHYNTVYLQEVQVQVQEPTILSELKAVTYLTHQQPRHDSSHDTTLQYLLPSHHNR